MINYLIIHNPKVLGGSSKSLVLLIEELEKNKQSNFYFFISKGEFENWVQKKGFKYSCVNWISHFDNTRYGYYRGLRWLVLLRELWNLIPSLYTLVKVMKKNQFDIVIINEAPLAIYSYVIKKLSSTKIVLFVRSLQSLKKNIRRKMFEFILKRFIDFIIPIDKNVLETLPKSVCDKCKIIHNGFRKPVPFNQKNKENRKTFNIGYIGVIYDAKGFWESLEAINILVNKKGLNNVKLFIAGKPIRDSKGFIHKIVEFICFHKDYLNFLNDFIDKNNLKNFVRYLGYIDNLDSFYNQLDLLLFVSKLDAVGRPVFEAGFYGVPSIVALKNPKEDTFIDMVTGIAIDEPIPEKIAEKVEFLYNNPKLLEELGNNAKKLSEKNFDIENNVKEFLELIYKMTEKN